MKVTIAFLLIITGCVILVGAEKDNDTAIGVALMAVGAIILIDSI